MIRLTVANTALDLPQRATVTVQGFNPALDDDSTERTFSFPFRLDATGRNLMALGYANRLDTDDDTLDRPALLEIDGATFQGQIEVNSRTSGTIEVVFQSAGRKLMGLAEQVQINEILPTIDVPQTIVRSWTITYLFDPDPLFVPVRQVRINGVMYGGTSVPPADLVDDINADYPGVASWLGGEVVQIVPGSITPFVVEDFEVVSFVDAVNTGTAQHDNFVAYLQAETLSPSLSHAFPVVYAPQFYRSNPAWRGYLNYQHGPNLPENTPSDGKQWAYACVPFVRAAYILDRLKFHIGIDIWAGFLADPDFEKLLLWNNYALDELVEDVYEFTEVQYLQAYKTQIALNQHVPEMSGRDFLNNIAEFFNLYYEKTGNTVTAKSKRKQLENVPIDWTDKVAGGHDLLMKQRGGSTLRFAAAQDGDKTTVPPQLADYIALAPGTNVVEVPFRPLHDIERTDPLLSTSQWATAYTAHTGTSDEGLKTPFGLRLLFDLGQQPDSDDVNYWQSSRSRLNMAGDPITDFDLDWPGEHGLYEKFWRGWAELIANAPSFQLPMRLEGHEIEEMNRWDNPLRYFRTPNGTVRAIIKSFEHRRSASGGKAETTVEFLRL